MWAGRVEAGPVLADLVVVGDCPVDQGDDDAVEAVAQGGEGDSTRGGTTA